MTKADKLYKLITADATKTGGSFIFPLLCRNVAQGGAAIAAFFIIKQNKKLKGVASAAGISALLGITEPAMFGVNLKTRYPFIGAIVGSGIGSAYIAFFKVKAIALGTAGLLRIYFNGFYTCRMVTPLCRYNNILHHCYNSYFTLSKRKANKEVAARQERYYSNQNQSLQMQ